MNKKEINFVLIYKFLINGSSVVVFDINVLAIVNFMGKIQRKYQKNKKLTKFTLKWYWMRCDVPLDRSTNTPAGDWRWRCPSR